MEDIDRTTIEETIESIEIMTGTIQEQTRMTTIIDMEAGVDTITTTEMIETGSLTSGERIAKISMVDLVRATEISIMNRIEDELTSLNILLIAETSYQLREIVFSLMMLRMSTDSRIHRLLLNFCKVKER